jgi:uncharacterized repeat protein (TIGR03803 family)
MANICGQQQQQNCHQSVEPFSVAMNGETMTMQRLNNLQILAMAMTLAVATLGVSGAHAQDFYTDIHDFDTPFLASPQYAGILAQGRDGNLYGTAPLGGTFGRGGVFMITPAGAYSVIRSFDGTMANP